MVGNEDRYPARGGDLAVACKYLPALYLRPLGERMAQEICARRGDRRALCRRYPTGVSIPSGSRPLPDAARLHNAPASRRPLAAALRSAPATPARARGTPCGIHIRSGRRRAIHSKPAHTRGRIRCASPVRPTRARAFTFESALYDAATPIDRCACSLDHVRFLAPLSCQQVFPPPRLGPRHGQVRRPRISVSSLSARHWRKRYFPFNYRSENRSRNRSKSY